MHDGFKSYKKFTCVFQQFKIFKQRHIGCFSRGNRLEYCAAHLDLVLGKCIWRKKHFQSKKPTKLALFFQVLCLLKIKSECAAQNSSLFLLIPPDLEKTIFFVNSEILGLQIWRKKRTNYDKFEIAYKQHKSNI